LVVWRVRVPDIAWCDFDFPQESRAGLRCVLYFADEIGWNVSYRATPGVDTGIVSPLFPMEIPQRLKANTPLRRRSISSSFGENILA
jgi:hypothetical protein